MSQENVETVRRAIAAVNDRDIDRYLACCTADVELRAGPGAFGGVYAGPDAVRRFNANLFDAGPDFRVVIESLEPVGSDRVLAFLRVTLHGRASGIAVADDIPTANIYDLVAGKIDRVRIFTDRHEALEAVGPPAGE
jgi:hypothetical protein